MEEKLNFNTIINSFLRLIPINVFIIFLITLYRLVFFLYFADFQALNGLYLYVLKAFWMGLRFDLSVIAYINIPATLLLFSCLLLKSDLFFKLSIWLLKIYYSFVFSVLFFVIFVDFGFFSYFKDHYNFLIFGLFEDDTVALIKTILSDYRFYIAVFIFIFTCFSIVKVSSWTYKELKFNERFLNTTYWKVSSKFLILFCIAMLNFAFARGSVSMFPLGIFYSQISPDYFINKLCINPVHPLADTVYYKIKNHKNSIELKNIFNKNEDSIAQDVNAAYPDKDITSINDIFSKETAENTNIKAVKPNVVFIVLEGFGSLPVFYNSAEFNVLGEFKRHFDEDIVFYNFLPAGFITIHAIESTVLNMPQRPLVNQITQTEDAFKQFASSAALPYKKSGYETVAVYGGSMTWRDLETFFKSQGFDKSIGEGNISSVSKDRHAWGINDKQFFELLKKELQSNTDGKPKFIYALSTGTHPPYKTHDHYNALPLTIPPAIANMMSSKDLNNESLFEVYQFANRQAANFMSMIKNSEFADNTIVAITGDHNLRELNNYSNEDLFLRYAVPLYIYIPKQLKPQYADLSQSGSHMDIMPTLYGLSLSETDYISAGNDLFKTKNNIAFNMDGLVIRDNIAIKYNNIDNSIIAFNINTDSKKLMQTDITDNHKLLENYYKSMMAASDMLIKSQK